MKAYKIIAGCKEEGSENYVANEEYYFNYKKAYQRYKEGEVIQYDIRFQYSNSKITDYCFAVTNVEKTIENLKNKNCKILEITKKTVNYFSIKEIEIN